MNDDRTFDLLPVIQWLEAGCDPKHAAAELRIYAERLAALSAAPAQEPVAKVVVKDDYTNDEFYWKDKGALLELSPGEYDLYLASPLPQEPQEVKALTALTDAPFPPEIEGRLSVWLTLGKELHPLTVNLVVRFARALASKLADAEKKYGYSDGWRSPDWMDECRAHLMEHIAKGDPRDVAAYCAFLWHPGESTASPIERELRGAQEGKAGEWLPIASAPNDGTVILYCDKRGNRWTDASPGHSANGCGLLPICWMPLPPPPSATLSASSKGEQR